MKTNIFCCYTVTKLNSITVVVTIVIDCIITITKIVDKGIITAGTFIDGVITFTADNSVITRAGLNVVVAIAAINVIITIGIVDRIVAETTINNVIA